MELFATLAGVIHSYTGLSQAAFFTILSLMVGAYLLVSALFVAPDAAADKDGPSVPKTAVTPQEAAPAAEAFVPPEPVQLSGGTTMQELNAYDGSDPKKPLLLAIKGQIFDVTRGRLFYGPGGHYSFFAGREISRALALMSFDPADLNDNIEDLSSSELEILHDWEEKFDERYVKVGRIVSEKPTDGCEDANERSTSEEKTN